MSEDSFHIYYYFYRNPRFQESPLVGRGLCGHCLHWNKFSDIHGKCGIQKTITRFDQLCNCPIYTKKFK